MFDRLYRHGRVAGIFLAAALLNACGGGSATAPDTEPFYLEPESEWALVWADEFDGAAVDSSNWTFQLGDGSDNGLPGWGNYERQYYQAENASIAEVDDTSALVIEARAESAGNSNYTSARMRSLEKFDFKFGRVEIRAKAAPGDGMWSAVWMMPTDSTYGTWAAGGEIDIMEVVNAGTENQGVFMAAHYGFEWPLNQITSEGAEVDDASDWHTYALEWSGDYLRWFVDGEHLRTVNKDVYYSYYFKDNTDGYQLASDPAAPFDGEFHLLVNLAVGGIGPGVELDPESVPGEMVVDYIRVYQCQYGTEGGVGCNTFADRSLESPEAQSPEVVTTDIYTDAVGPLTWSFLTGDVTRDLQAGVGYNNDGAIDIAVSEVAVEGRGNVLDVITSGGGNVVINAADGKTFDVYGHRGGGELKFDMYIDSSMTAPSSTIAIKMDSGYPALGSVSIDVAAMPKNEWFTYSASINDIVENRGERALALGAVQNLVVIEPSAAAHLQMDNIRLVCGTPNGDCGVAAPAQANDDLVITVLDENGQAGSAWSPGICAVSAENAFADDYCDGNTSNQITWSVVPTGDDAIGPNAVEVNFGDGVGGAWFIKDAQGLDLSDATGGTLKFDIELTNETVVDGIIFKVENDYPQGTGPIELDLTGYIPGTWASYEIPISDLLLSTNAELNNPPGGRLDLAVVKAFLVLSPNGEQGGKSFKVANVRLEREAGSETEDTGIFGTWMIRPGTETLGIGPEPFDVQWWSNNETVNDERACFFDDEYVFSRDGSFANVQGETTWVEAWQDADLADTCATPVAPHDGSIPATFEFDEAAETLTLTGQGAYMGLPKTVNGSELASPDLAPASVNYSAYLSDDRSSLDLVIEAIPGNYWTYQFIKTAEPPPPSFLLGTWVTSDEIASLGVGPEEFDTQWFNNTEIVNEERACFFDDEFTFEADGSLSIDYQGETWIESWQGSSEGADICGAPVAPHDGTGAFTWAHDADANELTLNGKGAAIGLPKVTNAGELSSPDVAPESLTYNIYDNEDGTATVTIQTQDSGNWWQHKMVKIAELPGDSPIAGSWYLSTEEASMGVGPEEFDTQWFNNTAIINEERACWFDDEYVFGADGSFSINHDDSTWLEGWQGGEASDACGSPVAPHDGSPASFIYDAEGGTLTLNGVGAYIGLPKVTNAGELASPDTAPGSLQYNAYLDEDTGELTLTIQTSDSGNWWQFVLVR